MMNSITDHYISDYKNYKNLTTFHEETGIDLDEFMEKSGKFYHDWMYNYYCTNTTCSMESSRLMEDLLGYMQRRIQYYPQTTYKAPKLVIDCGHDTTVAPMQMFMYETWEDKPEYGVRTQYCGFACNIYFELYKAKSGPNAYYVYYYIDDELIHIFDYDEFDKTIREHLYTQDEITEYCITDEEKEEIERKKKEEEEQKKKEEEQKEKEEELKSKEEELKSKEEEQKAKEEEQKKIGEEQKKVGEEQKKVGEEQKKIGEEQKNKEEELKAKEEELKAKEEEVRQKELKGDTFAESFEKHTLLWVGLFAFIFTTILGIVGILVMYLKMNKVTNSKSSTAIEGEHELTNKLIINS